jgi:hypothetical protein
MTTLHLYLPEPMRSDAARGKVNVINRILAALPGWRAVWHPDTQGERLRAAGRGGYSLWHMQTAPDPRGLCLRRAYWYPFWTLDRHNERWLTDTARATYDPATVDPALARPFFRRLRRRHLGDGKPRRDGFVLIPLQGRLFEHRSFQAASPLAMIEAVLEADPRPVRVTMHPHPKEPYTAAERRAVERLVARHRRLTLDTTPSEALLMACDLVVTQNSSTALTGFLAGKPAVLFAGTDFHHIAGSVPRDGLGAAFEKARGPMPDPALYLYWFLQMQAINAGADMAVARIRARLAALGWPVPSEGAGDPGL